MARSVKLWIRNSNSKVSKLPLPILLALKAYVDVEYKGFGTVWKESKSGRRYPQRGFVTKRLEMFELFRRTLKTGLVDRAIEFFDNPPEGMPEFDLQIIDKRDPLGTAPVRPHPKLLKFPKATDRLRDDQIDVITVARRRGRGIIKLPTGAGKTVVAAGIIASYGMPGTLFLVNKGTLLRQQAKELEARLGVPVGIIGDGKKDVSKVVTVATVQSLASMLGVRAGTKTPKKYKDWVRSIKVIFLDECHNVTQNTGEWVEVTQRFFKASRRFGLSATPFNKSRPEQKWNLISVTGEVIAGLTSKELIDAGVLAQPHVMLRSCSGWKPLQEDLSKLHFGQRYAKEYNHYIVENDKRNDLVCEAAEEFLKRGIKTMVICLRRNHVFDLANRLKKHKPVVILGNRKSGDSAKRDQAIADFHAGKTNLMCGNFVIDEGLNVPDVGAVILAGAGKTERGTLQRIGRGIRKKDGLNVVFVVDFDDQDGKFNPKHSRQRVKTMKAEKAFKFAPKDCKWSYIDRVRRRGVSALKSTSKGAS